MPETMTIGKNIYQYHEVDIHHSSLRFYPENPRIYSLLVIDGQIPEQSEIEEQLVCMEYVRELKSAIEQNGGLIDPLIVRDGDFVVLEGNSRLAAYRILAKKDPVRWSFVKCKVLPSDISDEAIFALLGQYHIIGRKDWSPFEQAGYLWRRMNDQDITPEMLAKEIGGLTAAKIRKMYSVYEFMKRNDAVDPQKWSYYEEYFKARAIKKAREEMPEIDSVVIRQIKMGEISQAIDIRQKLEPITRIQSQKRRKKILKAFIEGEKTLDECFEDADISGKGILNNLISIKNKLNSMDLKKHTQNMNDEEKRKYQFELKKIGSRIKDLERDINV